MIRSPSAQVFSSPVSTAAWLITGRPVVVSNVSRPAPACCKFVWVRGWASEVKFPLPLTAAARKCPSVVAFDLLGTSTSAWSRRSQSPLDRRIPAEVLLTLKPPGSARILRKVQGWPDDLVAVAHGRGGQAFGIGRGGGGQAVAASVPTSAMKSSKPAGLVSCSPITDCGDVITYACGMPRGKNTNEPGSASHCSLPHAARMLPSKTKKASSSSW